MRNLKTLLIACFFLGLTACGGGQSQSGNESSENDKEKKDQKEKGEASEDDEDMREGAMMKNGLKIYPIETKNFPDAKLMLEAPEDSEVDTGSHEFQYNVKNFTLKEGTSDADKHNLAESDKGQHIHFIVNNGPYQAKYDPTFEATMDEPGYYTVFSFLSRSYHESVKNPNAFVIKQFKVGEPEKGEQADLSKPHLFYSRPKGTYKGKDFKKLLLDFYPVNVDNLSKDGYKVEATINGNTTFTLTEHKPYVIEGLEAGKLKVKLSLLNENDELVDSKFNEVTRTVTLKSGMNDEGMEDEKSSEGKMES